MTALDDVRRTSDDQHAEIRQKETAQDRRDKAVRRAHEAGASLQVIADVLGVHRTYVHQIIEGRLRSRADAGWSVLGTRGQ